MPSIIQPSFSGGELSSEAFGRVDLARYQTSLRTCRNFLTRVYGGAQNRPGTRMICEVKDSSKSVRLIPNAFSTTQTYVLEFGDLYARVVKDGGQVLFTSGPSIGLPFELATPYSEAIRREIKFSQLADVMTIVHPTIRPKQLSRTAHDAWTLTDFAFEDGPFQEINVDKNKGVTASATTGAGVVLKSSHAIFTAEHVGMLFYLEQKDFGRPWEVGKNVNLGDIRRADGRYYKARNSGSTGTLRPTHDSVGDTESDGTVTWEYMHSGFGVALITAFTNANQVTVTVLSQIPEPVVGTAKTVTGAVDNGSGAIRITVNSHGYTDDNSIMIYGIAGTAEANGVWKINSTGANTFDLIGSTFTNAYVSGGQSIPEATYKYAFGAWGGAQGWPSVVSFHQQRQVFAATPQAPQNVWMSGVNAYTFFGKSVPLAADDAVSFRLAGAQVNAIQAIVSLNQMIILTTGGEWVVHGGDNDAIAPNAIFAKVQGYSGASEVPPVFIRDAILYLQNKGQTFRDMSYQFTADKYDGQDLSVLASHLLEGRQIVEWAFQQVPFSTLWAIRDDGILIGLTYMREQQVLGWHRHDTDGEFESVCVVSEGNEDAVYVVVKRIINGQTKRYIERLASRLYEDIKDAFFVDCGLTYDGRNAGGTVITISGGTTWKYNQDEVFTATASAAIFSASTLNDEIHMNDADGRVIRLLVTLFVDSMHVRVQPNRDIPVELRNTAVSTWTLAQKTFTGLSHLEGKTVSVLADGNVLPQVVVTGGSIAIANAAGVVHVGLPIEADFETLDLSVPSAETLLPRQKIVNAVRLMVEESRGIFAGPDADHLLEFKQRSNEAYDDPVDELTGMATVRVPSTWSKGGRVFVRQSDPLPLSILAAIPEVAIGGTA